MSESSLTINFPWTVETTIDTLLSEKRNEQLLDGHRIILARLIRGMIWLPMATIELLLL